MLNPFTCVRPDFSTQAVRALASAPPTSATRWVIGGMMGSGKTALARRLSAAWGIEHVEIDLFATPQEAVDYIHGLPFGWVAEANPWQIPAQVWDLADWIVFLDFDNLVNYTRLLRRGLERWKASREPWRGFHRHLLTDAILDWCRIVYRYGEANRAGWRQNGIDGGLARHPARCVRCVSPREADLLCRILAETVTNRAAASR